MKEFGSFRDPSGFVFYRDDVVFRQVNACYRTQYEKLMKSGLYRDLTASAVLIAHEETQAKAPESQGFLVIQPERIPFISYPYEWSFGQLKDAALVTLNAHRRALDVGMILKDASAYNIQFLRGRPVLIDTLSFDFYQDDAPWVAYGQFVRHFLAPLMLMAHVDARLSQLLRVYIDGIPLDLARTLLRGRGGFAATQHISWHARAIASHAQDGKTRGKASVRRISKFNHTAMIDSLIRIVEKLSLKHIQTEWSDYYAHMNYSDTAAGHKESLVQAMLDEIAPNTTWDLGANDGRYSRLALKYGGTVVAFDLDPIAVERNYSAVRASREPLLPLLLDLTNPSPNIGFANRERMSIDARQRPDVILMLAVVHHLAISNNLPLESLAEWIRALGDTLIIEFVPKSDSQVQTLLATRDDIFPDYTRVGFERAFAKYFETLRAETIDGSERVLYLMRVK